MDNILSEYFSKIKFGKIQQFENMALFPLFANQDEKTIYITLNEALQKNLITIKEVNQSGSVPELMVINNAEVPVLLIDGEELIGAKQNRTLNTTILLKEQSQTIIPVSCTEAGRWDYISDTFKAGGYLASPSLRALKSSSVTESLRSHNQYVSDQNGIWNTINDMAYRAGTKSSTGAMQDIFNVKSNQLEGYLKAFPSLPGQKGLFVIINGKIAGFDLISLSSAYKILHPKLVKSYALESILQKDNDVATPSIDEAKKYIKNLENCVSTKHMSVGYGWDYRFRCPDKVGSALLYQDNVIHIAFFSVSERDNSGNMTGMKQRKNYRI